ncbi:MAG: MBL fold metallo-hydrolase [Clostridia bacterium]|nr:MBL fold metallo-hydrolase [Clostridia bacterium]
MKIKWLGHSSFLITTNNDTKILTDPVDKESGYDIGITNADIVTLSHDHHDHSNTSILKNTACIITTAGEHSYHDIKLTGIPTWHDEICGQKRGNNIMFLIEADDIRILHAGDLGQLPDPLTLNAIGKTDILLVPIGGVYTIDYEKALALMNILNPKLTIPMHFRTPSVTFKLGDLSPFLNRASDKYAINKINSSEFEISTPLSVQNTIFLPDYTK